jgi:PPOX class probable F420-dependent enzyme
MVEPLRAIERRLYARFLHPGTSDLGTAAVVPWDPRVLDGHHYCVLVSYRRDGRAVPTPVWFARRGDAIVIRSAASDGKIKRIRHDGRVKLAPCDVRGRVLGPALLGDARILGGSEAEAAEHALARAHGLRRRIYRLLRDPVLDPAYIEVAPGDQG